MLTTPEQFAAMTDGQRFDALIRAEMQRNNAELLLRQGGVGGAAMPQHGSKAAADTNYDPPSTLSAVRTIAA